MATTLVRIVKQKDKGEICSGCDADAHGQSIDVVGDGSDAGAGARWCAGNDDGARGARWTEAGSVPPVFHRLIPSPSPPQLDRYVSWLGFHPMSQHTLFEAASRLDLGYEYVGTRSSSIAALRLQRREDAFANHLPSYSQLAEFATGGTEEGGDNKGRSGALIMNGDMVWTGTWYLCSAFVVAQLEYIYL
ncbi:hypothetical protein B0H13DRAFT_1886594 [Mycena leptocephala]|nr:hypothetical protein B0H13DRAFT_1886594 [Mycena leptocephala]